LSLRILGAGSAGEACRPVGRWPADTSVGLAEGSAPLNQKEWPATVDEAVGVVIATLSDEDKATISAMAESELIGLHMSLGAWIRNNFGLWSGNRPLLESTGEPNADDTSMAIIVAVWRRLREMVTKVH
jgi:hypothetical protein